jgi:enamine deaminase RidA (YjgF/YER057c/UK114 family)
LEHHSANQFLKAATNLNVVQPKLFQASRQDDLRFSDCTVSVIQILDDADAAFRILGAGLRTVLSVTTMFADKPHRLNGRMRAAILCFDDLASGTALAVGLPAQRAIAQRFRALAHRDLWLHREDRSR